MAVAALAAVAAAAAAAAAGAGLAAGGSTSPPSAQLRTVSDGRDVAVKDPGRVGVPNPRAASLVPGAGPRVPKPGRRSATDESMVSRGLSTELRNDWMLRFHGGRECGPRRTSRSAQRGCCRPGPPAWSRRASRSGGRTGRSRTGRSSLCGWSSWQQVRRLCTASLRSQPGPTVMICGGGMLPAQNMRGRCVMSVNCSAAVSSRTNAGADVAAVCRDQGRRRDFPDVREHVIVER